jgi:IstB-like ATP binding protein
LTSFPESLALAESGRKQVLNVEDWAEVRRLRRAEQMPIAETWTHEEFLAACLQREVAARESHGGEGRIRAARFPSRKSLELEDFDYDHARGLKREAIAHLGTLDFVTARENVIFLGRAPARPTWPPAWPSAPARPGTGSCSPPPPDGLPGSPRPATPAGCKPSWSGSAATRSW